VDEWKSWPLGDPIERLKNHLIAGGEWSDAQHDDLVADTDREVLAAAGGRGLRHLLDGRVAVRAASSRMCSRRCQNIC
jgi:2-oxoisovalerate dehydrogenase E1 component alpha subunit